MPIWSSDEHHSAWGFGLAAVYRRAKLNLEPVNNPDGFRRQVVNTCWLVIGVAALTCALALALFRE